MEGGGEKLIHVAWQRYCLTAMAQMKAGIPQTKNTGLQRLRMSRMTDRTKYLAFLGLSPQPCIHGK